MQKKQYWNVKTLVFMALLIACIWYSHEFWSLLLVRTVFLWEVYVQSLQVCGWDRWQAVSVDYVQILSGAL